MAQRAFLGLAAGLVGVCLLLSSGRVLAQTPSASASASASRAPRVHLSWTRDAEAAEACPGATQVQADVAERLGFSPFVVGDARSASIEVLVTHDRARWQAAVAMRDADGGLRGNRHVESAAADCHSLAAAAALAIALMIDPELLLRPPPRPAAAPTPESSPAPSSTPPVSLPASSSLRTPPRGAVAIGATVAVGVLPEPAFGPILRGELELFRHWSIVASAQFFPGQQLTRAGTDAWLGLTLGRFGPCYRVKLGDRWAIASCGSILLGSLSLSIAAPEAVQAGPRAWLGVASGLSLTLQTGALELAFEADALAHLRRHDYTVAREQPPRSESLFTEPAVGVLGSLTTGVRF